MMRIILLMTVATLVVVSTLFVVRRRGAQASHGQGTRTSNQDGLDKKLQLQAGQHHHQAWNEGQMDQQGQHYAHRNGEQRKIV